MWVGLDCFGRILVDATLATTVLLCLVILLLLFCQQPARRIVVVQAAFVLALFTFPLVATGLLTRLDEGSSLGGESARSEAGPTCAKSTPDFVTQGRVRKETATRNTWQKAGLPLRVLTVAYLTGVTVAMLWTILGFWGIERVVASAVEPSPATLSTYDEMCHRLAERLTFPALRVSARISRPAVVGVFHSVILIPPSCDEQSFDKESLRIILLHELAHAIQGDTYFNAVASVAQNLWFFLPFLWWGRAQLRIDQEFLADHKVALLTGSPAGYATRLVALAAAPQGSTSDWAVEQSSSPHAGRGANSGLRSPLLQRVLMLLYCPYPLELKPPRSWAIAAPLLVAGLAFGSVCVSLVLVERRFLPTKTSFVADTPNRFRISQFVASPLNGASRVHGALYTFPLLLPPQFLLEVEIHASPSALSHIRLVGLALGSPEAASRGSDDRLRSKASWHRIQVRRQGEDVTLTVDDKTSRVDRDSTILTQWLTIEPAADDTVLLRNLELRW
jgi:beta-lactamase regulating signal transducer with metallopeptidase domain